MTPLVKVCCCCLIDILKRTDLLTILPFIEMHISLSRHTSNQRLIRRIPPQVPAISPHATQTSVFYNRWHVAVNTSSLRCHYFHECMCRSAYCRVMTCLLIPEWSTSWRSTTAVPVVFSACTSSSTATADDDVSSLQVPL